jgi:hypothetical protein
MGLFDFLKRKDKAAASGSPSSSPVVPPPAAPEDELEAALKSLETPPARLWHYEFAHVALRIGTFNHPDQVVRYLSNPATAQLVVKEVLARVAEELRLPREEVQAFARELTVSAKPLDNGTLVIVAMPSPVDDTEAYFVGIAVDDPNAPARVKYYTLERARRGQTMLCGWSREGGHLNFGEGPAATIEAFAAAVAARL